MEVHLSGIAEYLEADALKKKLDPIMAALDIPDHAFTCLKPRRLKWASVTFLQRSQGQAFMDKHGQQLLPPALNGVVWKPKATRSKNASSTRPRYRAKLNFMGNDVFCSLSKHQGSGAASVVPGQPDPITLRGLQNADDEKVRPTRKIVAEAAPNVFEVSTLACGQNAFDSSKLVFLPGVQWSTSAGTAKFGKKTLLIKFSTCSGPTVRIMRILIETIVNVVCSSNRFLNLTLSEVPAFFLDTSTAAHDVDQLGLQLGAMSLTSRYPSNEPTRVRIGCLDDQHRAIVGHCLVYQLEVSAGADLPHKMRSLLHHEGLRFIRFSVPTQWTPPPHLGCTEQSMDALMAELSAPRLDSPLPFGILFQLQALAYNAYLHPGIVLALTRTLRRTYKADHLAGRRLISVDAFKMLRKQCPWPEPHLEPSFFEVAALIERLRSNEKKVLNGNVLCERSLVDRHTMAYIHRVTVTPSRITLHGPELEANNRILRKFPNHHEYFIRVQFCDENGQDLFFSSKISYEVVWESFKKTLKRGISIAGRQFYFLGFSHSSLRSHSSWFSAAFVGDDGSFQTHETIIKALGRFTHIRSPAKCAARIGQAFSETPFSLPLEEHGIDVVEIPDVKRGARVFSDGVGRLSWAALHHVRNVVPPNKIAPTAFQIRYRGAKGMLALDPTLRGSVVQIRPSMTKFESGDKSILEICDMASKPIPLVLNRQVVKILEDMGVTPGWFLHLQNTELTRIRQIMANPYSTADFLQHKNVGESIRFHHFFRQTANMAMDWRKEPFLRSVVEAMVLKDLRLLKYKARIPVAKGITLFGIMDETNFLLENEVYVTYDHAHAGNRYEPPPASGQQVLVTRSPALHPGDIQHPRNVVPPQDHPLRSLTNVIVFSQRGARDLPSQLSGGDLDGDIFSVIWDARATPVRTFRPADYPRVAALDLGREVTKDDMAGFFVDFMRLDCLGVIATRHLIIADQMEEGTLHGDCLKLAQLHSTAVDFSKTGKGVDIRELPRSNKYRPDFLAPGPETRLKDWAAIELDEFLVEPAPDEEEDQFAGARYEYYKSSKVLGHLYRAIDEQKIWQEDIRSKVPPSGTSFWDEFLVAIRPHYEALTGDGTGWADHVETAREIRGWYEDAISGAMYQYSQHPINPISELEVFTGSIVNGSGVQTSRQRDSSLKLGEEFERIALWISRQMRKVSHDPDVPLTGYQTQYDNLHLCLACVHMGGKAGTWQKGRAVRNMQSFRVVAACAMLAELRAFQVGRGGGGGGGYVGVRGGSAY